jgi:hypothetical protein
MRYSDYTPPTAPYEGGGYSDSREPGAGDPGDPGKPTQQTIRLGALRNSRSRVLRRRGYGGHLPPDKYFAPGAVDFLMPGNRPTTSPLDFITQPGTGFQMAGNQGLLSNLTPDPKPKLVNGEYYLGDVAAATRPLGPATSGPLYTPVGAGTGFMLPQNRPPPKK